MLDTAQRRSRTLAIINRTRYRSCMSWVKRWNDSGCVSSSFLIAPQTHLGSIIDKTHSKWYQYPTPPLRRAGYLRQLIFIDGIVDSLGRTVYMICTIALLSTAGTSHVYSQTPWVLSPFAMLKTSHQQLNPPLPPHIVVRSRKLCHFQAIVP